MKEYKVYMNHRGYIHLQDDLNDQAQGGWRLVQLVLNTNNNPQHSVWERDVPVIDIEDPSPLNLEVGPDWVLLS